MDGWHPRYFNPRKLPFNWAGGDHEWTITERTARDRHRNGEDLAVGYESDAEVGHTMVRPLPQGVTSIEHRDPVSGRLLHASVAERRLVRLAVSAPGGPLVARNHHPLVRFGRPGHTQKRVPRVEIDWARETGFTDPAFYASGDPLPTLPDLTGWDSADAVAELCAALPGAANDLVGLSWHAYADDAPERAASILERLGAAARLAEIFVPDTPPVPKGRRWFGRRSAAGADVDQDERWNIGAAGLDALLAATGRRFGKHPDDRSRILTAPVADGEVTLAVTVESRPGPPDGGDRARWSTCRAPRRPGPRGRRRAGGRCSPTTSSSEPRSISGWRSSTPTPRSSPAPSSGAWSRWTCRRRTDLERFDRWRQTSSRKRSKTRAPNSRASTGTRSSMPWNSAVKSRSSGSRSGAKP